MPVLHKAQDAAEYFLWLASHERESDPDYLTPLKLQKLLYYLQGWSFAERGQPFFREPIQAWRDGPVVPEVYAHYQGRETKPIVDQPPDPPAALTESDRALVRAVWDAYKRHSGWTLSDMTHAEPPYLETYQPMDREGRCNRTISSARIEQYFKSRAIESTQRAAKHRDRLRALAEANTMKMVGRPIL